MSEKTRIAQLEADLGVAKIESISLRAEVERLHERLALDVPHPFPEDYDAIDMLNDRLAAYKDENTALKERLEALADELEATDENAHQFIVSTYRAAAMKIREALK